MANPEDNRLVDYLYGELSPAETRAFEHELQTNPALAAELASLRSLRSLVSTLAEDPPAHLDSLILAHARQATPDPTAWSKLRKWLVSPAAGLMATAAAGALIFVAVGPTMRSSEPAREDHVFTPAPVPAAQAPVATAPEGAAEGSLELKAEPSKKEAPGRRARAVTTDQAPALKPAVDKRKEVVGFDDFASDSEAVGGLGASQGPRGGGRPPAPVASRAKDAPPAEAPSQVESERRQNSGLAQQILQRVEVAVQAGKLDQARVLLDQGLSKVQDRPDRAALLGRRARLEWQAGSCSVAQNYAQQALALDPRQNDALVTEVNCLAR